MNNSRIEIESVSLQLEADSFPAESFRQREAQLVKLIAAVKSVFESKAWSSLKTELFEGLTDRLQRELLSESKKPTPDTNKLNRLSGQLQWAERYSDLQKLEQEFKAELAIVKSKLYGKTEKLG